MFSQKKFIDALTAFFSKPKSETANQVPEGACGNCWGFYEYDNQVRDIIRDRQVDIENNLESRNFIEKFVASQVDGVRLINEVGTTGCKLCMEKAQEN